MLKQRVGIAIVVIAVGLGVTIGKSGAFKDYLPFSSSSPRGKSVASTRDDPWGDKLAPFIDCINTTDSLLRANYKSYRSFYQAHTEDNKFNFYFSGFKLRPFEQDNSISKECITGLETAITQSPSDETLDKNGKIYAEALKKLLPLLNTADIYYNQKDYKDDAFKKGSELDGQITPLFDTLFNTSDQLRQTIATRNLERQKIELADLEKENGRDFQWHSLNTMYQARLTLMAFDELVSSGKLSVETLKPIEASFQKVYDEAEAYAAANPNVKVGAGRRPLWFSIRNYVGSLLASIKTVRRDLSENNTSGLNSDIDSVGENFNSLVKSYNQQVRIGGY